MEDAVRVIDNGMASGVHGYISCLDLMLCHRSRSARAGKEKIEHERSDLEEAEQKTSEMFKMQDQAPLYIKCSGV